MTRPSDSDVDFYPRSPCGERLLNPFKTLKILTFLSTLSLRRATTGLGVGLYLVTISIHALLAESDLYDTYAKVLRVNISIHALLAESDSRAETIATKIGDFYPRSPCGERQPSIHV